VVASGQGQISVTEVQQALMALIKENAIPYAKLIDMTYAPLAMRAANLRVFAERMNEFNKGKTVGPLAVVASSELAREMITLFDSMVETERPMKIFTNQKDARAWLAGLGYGPEGQNEKQPADAPGSAG
jgi:hypothetical protein